ncbi:MAG TPA: alpha/beta hydrolase [Natrialbaceae archaeon]|nr:alpha/beta hydrolase [Natrialbaceae archaeon]
MGRDRSADGDSGDLTEPRELSRNGVRLVYRTDGDPDARPLVLLHGLGADHSMWGPQIDRYPDEGYHLIVPDVRGFGDSDPVPSFEIEDCADDLAAIIDDYGVDAAAVAGVSMGSLIAQVFAAKYPERVTRLVLSDTFSSVHGVRARVLSRVATAMLSIVPTGLQIRLVESQYDAPADEPIREYFRTQLVETDRDQLVRARRAVNAFDGRDDLHRIDAPTLVVVGDDNPGWFVELARETAEGIPDARFEELPGGSDPSNLTATDAFDDAVLAFLADARS